MEETLKEIMGESYKDSMSKDEIQAFFKKQILSSGEYTNSGKANAEKQELNSKISNLQAQLEAKMTDDEKNKKANADTQKLIQDLQKQLAESKSNQSKMSAISLLAEAKLKAGIKDDDNDFDNFISEISFEDNDKTTKISKYISKIVSDAYEIGKNEAIKNKLGKLGYFKENSGTDSDDDEGAFGRQLAQSTKRENKNAKNFFERK